MDKLADYGLAGLMILIGCGGIVGASRWASGILTKQIESREHDLTWFRTEMELMRKEFLQAMEKSQTDFRAQMTEKQANFTQTLKVMQEQYVSSLSSIKESFSGAIQTVCARLETIEKKVS